MNKDLHKLVWLVLPIIVAVMPYVARFIDVHTDGYMYGEKGIIENITVIFLLTAIIACLLFIFAKEKIPFASFKVWMVLFLLGAIYYAGEEMSWGQHFFGWGTPEKWTEFNDQQETNLHTGFCDQMEIPITFEGNVKTQVAGIILLCSGQISNGEHRK